MKTNNDELINPEISNEMRIREKEYTKYNNYIIFIGSWNIGGKKFNNVIDVSNWLIDFKNHLNFNNSNFEKN
jgi:hypothetical protein